MLTSHACLVSALPFWPQPVGRFNIAAALFGGTIARTVFRNKVHIGYLAAIVAASKAGGSLILVTAIVVNVVINVRFNEISG